ncbi:MAG: hypothetical protein E7310_01480 [Clostridiales bacterium]|nr:hypothetical protein [Clostridiales bacterium]
MEIINARIKNVTVGLDDRDRLAANMTFECPHGSCSWGFILTNPTDSQRLLKLLQYTGANEVNNLNGKIVRAINHDCCFAGFGDPIKDEFVPTFGEELKEVTEVQFKELLETK